MSRQQWRKALWHLRHGGVEGFKEFRRRSDAPLDIANGAQDEPHSINRVDRPTLSVVVPAFNASDFIERCLRSVLDQTDVELEVFVVDDGSNDETVQTIADAVKGDERVTVLTGHNQGPADARNRGVESARGRYITFVDADDEVLPGAYLTMVNSLERTGSDIATGSYMRIGKLGRSRPKLTARVHARQRLAVRLDDMPELLEEPVLWNKVYRREFWIRHVGRMQGFANYEDQPPVYRALVAAAAIDVLTTDVYAWRLAEGRNTRSRRKAKLTDLYAKLEVIEVLRSTLEHVPDHVLRQAHAIWMGTDLAMHAEFLDTARKRFRKALCKATKDLKKSMPRSAWKLIPAQERLFMWVVATGDLDDIEEILGTRAEETTAVPLEFVDGRWHVAPTYLKRLKTEIPPRLLKACAVDFKPSVVVRNVRWVGDREIEIHGCAYVPGVVPEDTEFKIQGVMDGATVFDVGVEPWEDNRVDLELEDPWRSYTAGGFRARVDISRIDDVSPRGVDLVGAFELLGTELHSPAKSTTTVGMIAPSPIRDNERVTVVADDHDELSIRPVDLPEAPILVKHVGLQGRDVTVTLNSVSDVRELTLNTAGQRIPLAALGRSIYTAALPELPDRYRSGGERLWTISAKTTENRHVAVYHEAVDYLLPDTSCLRLEPNLNGAVHLAQRFQRVTVTGATNDRDRLLITGRVDPAQKLSVVLRSSEQTIVPAENDVHGDGTFTVIYDLTTVGSEGGRVAALSGGFYVRYGDSPNSANGWARVAEKLAIRPVDCYTVWNTLRLEGGTSGSVAVTASPPWSAQERTKYGRFKLREREWGPLTEGIVFESYNGKSANDNPRALFESIRAERDDIPLYWSVRDRRVDVPEDGIPIVEGTAAWHKALATSRVWINNNNFPYYVRKRPGQFYLQTWHGTPIKKLLWDMSRRRVALTYRRLMSREVPQWDRLLAQSRSASERLQSGLGYSGEIQILEAPRNIRISELEASTKSIRENLGLIGNGKILLYAPTWREYHRSGATIQWTDLIDLQSLARNTGTEILVRAHHVTHVLPSQEHNIFDVSTATHVEDLIAAADLLITDYSSIAYDFELTGRPIIYFVPDLKRYTKERGLYEELPSRSNVAYNEFELTQTVNAILRSDRSQQEASASADGYDVLVQEMVSIAKSDRVE